MNGSFREVEEEIVRTLHKDTQVSRVKDTPSAVKEKLVQTTWEKEITLS